jgi:hypothetical protein
MAPEQARGSSEIDLRADIWALCVVLYECVTGRMAFEGDNHNALMRAIVEDEVIPITDVAAGDTELWSILQRGLQKDPSARWSSARELGTALAEWLMGHGVEVDISGEPLRAWLEPDSSKPRDLLSVPPPSGPAMESGRTALSRTQGGKSAPLAANATLVAAVVLLVLGATVVITLVAREHEGAAGWRSVPVVGASRTLESTAAIASEPPRERPSAQVAVEPPHQATPERAVKPQAAPPRAPGVQKTTRGSPSGASGSDLKDPY